MGLIVWQESIVLSPHVEQLSGNETKRVCRSEVSADRLPIIILESTEQG